jgi:hypothetical protein
MGSYIRVQNVHRFANDLIITLQHCKFACNVKCALGTSQCFANIGHLLDLSTLQLCNGERLYIRGTSQAFTQHWSTISKAFHVADRPTDVGEDKLGGHTMLGMYLSKRK